MQLFCAAVCFLFTAVASLKTSKLAFGSNSDVFDDSDDPYIICEMDGILVPFFIEEYRYKTDTVILLKLKNVDDEKAAREFSNREVFYSLDEVDRDDLVEDMTWDIENWG